MVCDETVHPSMNALWRLSLDTQHFFLAENPVAPVQDNHHAATYYACSTICLQLQNLIALYTLAVRQKPRMASHRVNAPRKSCVSQELRNETKSQLVHTTMRVLQRMNGGHRLRSINSCKSLLSFCALLLTACDVPSVT